METVMIVEMTKEVSEKQKEICETRAWIKNWSMDQLIDKKLLRMPHYSIPEIKYSWPWNPTKIYTSTGTYAAGVLTNRVRERAAKITCLHTHLNELRGKENSHAYKN